MGHHFDRGCVSSVIIVSSCTRRPSRVHTALSTTERGCPRGRVVTVFRPRAFAHAITLLDRFTRTLRLTSGIFLYSVFNSTHRGSKRISVNSLTRGVRGNTAILGIGGVSPLLRFRSTITVFVNTKSIRGFRLTCRRLLDRDIPAGGWFGTSGGSEGRFLNFF